MSENIRCRVCGGHTFRPGDGSDHRCDDCRRRADFAELVNTLPKLPIRPIGDAEGKQALRKRFVAAANAAGWTKYQLEEVLDEADSYSITHFEETLKKFMA